MSKDDYFKGLTGYRAMAAYMVFLFHFNCFEKGSFEYAFTSGLRIGVPLFFVLSGFLIYTRYNTSEVTVPFYKKYMLNRVARIYPVYFLANSLTLLFLVYSNSSRLLYWLKVYLLNITFARGYFQKYWDVILSVGWSLTVEETFYILAPLLFLIASDSIKKYLLLFIVIFGSGWLLSFISIHIFHGFFWSTYGFMVSWTFFGHSFAFIVGIIVGVINKRIKTVSFKYFTLIGFSGLLISLLFMSRFAVMEVASPANAQSRWIWTFFFEYFSIPFIGAIIWGLIHEDTFVSRILSTKIFDVLGKSSYSFYLIHFSFINIIINMFISKNAFVHFAIILFVSILTWKLIEEPLNHRIRTWGFTSKPAY